MADTITITCPECEKTLKAPSDVLGKKIRCKGCGTTFAARESGQANKAVQKEKPEKPKAAKPKAQKAAADDDEDNNPYGVNEEKLGHRCPDCANAMESDDAVVCLHCGYNTLTRERSRTRKVRDVTGGDHFLWLLPGIACALLFLGLATCDLLFIILIDRETFGGEEVWYSFVGSLGTKVWTTVIVLYALYLSGKFAMKRLIFENTPPEIEER